MANKIIQIFWTWIIFIWSYTNYRDLPRPRGFGLVSLSLGTDKCRSRLQLILDSFLIKANRDIGFSLSVWNSVSISESLLLLFLNRTRNQNYFYDYFDTLLIKTLKCSHKSKLCDLSILLGQAHYDFFTDCNSH